MSLSALEVSKAKTPGYYGDGGGLWLQISAFGTKSWVFRFKSPLTGKPREMGLGDIRTYSLAEARQRATQARQLVNDGRDPIEERKQARRQTKEEASRIKTFRECASAYIEAHSPGWKNDKHQQQWKATLETYAYPVLGEHPVSSVDTALILKVLEPIWAKKNETASRLRGRLESVLSWAKVRGYRIGDNPATWKGHLENLLARPSKVAKVTNQPALPFAQGPKFMKHLRTMNGLAPRALELTILTAARSGEIRGAEWREFDLEAKVWTIPAGRMKADKEHRIPLSDAAQELLKALPRIADSDLLFPGTNNQPLSDATLNAVIRRMHASEQRADEDGYLDPSSGRVCVPHGFRSSFRDWAGETTAFPREVIEHALAHQLKDKAEAAYARGTLFDKRRALMDAWALYLESPVTTQTTSEQPAPNLERAQTRSARSQVQSEILN